MQIDENKFNMIISALQSAENDFARQFAKDRINIAKVCIEAGFLENLLDTPIVQNTINLLAPFIKNVKIKKAISLMQEVIEEHRKQQKWQGTPWKK